MHCLTTEVVVRGSKEGGFSTLLIFPRDAPAAIEGAVLTEGEESADPWMKKMVPSKEPLSSPLSRPPENDREEPCLSISFPSNVN
jgi:hypothetical protein